MNKLSSPDVTKTDLYAASEKIYPREVAGRFQTLRSSCVTVLLGLYYLGPWLQWNNRQAVLFDLPGRKFHIFELTLWPQDFFLLALLLILAGISLFFFTAIAGRVWCGYACPQTVWTEAFIWMERWVEGSRAQQMKLSAMPWNFTKLRKRAIKQVLWISFSLFTGLTFVGYFLPIRELVTDFFTLDVAGWSLFWVLFYGFATYGNAGFMREQVCKYMCPYARFQSAMFDRDTLIVAYNEARGEPRRRGKKRNSKFASSGDCIDCGLCVQVCPTGIDIRDGLQYECIACAACVDVCDEVMAKVELPPGLIRYSSENLDQESEKSLKQVLLRPRMIIYATLLAAVFIGFIVTLLNRPVFQVDVLRDRNALYRWNENAIENIYLVRVMNKGQLAQQYTIDVDGALAVSVAWANPQSGALSRRVAAGEIGEFSTIVSLDSARGYKRSQALQLRITEADGSQPATVVEQIRFLAPAININQ